MAKLPPAPMKIRIMSNDVGDYRECVAYVEISVCVWFANQQINVVLLTSANRPQLMLSVTHILLNRSFHGVLTTARLPSEPKHTGVPPSRDNKPQQCAQPHSSDCQLVSLAYVFQFYSRISMKVRSDWLIVGSDNRTGKSASKRHCNRFSISVKPHNYIYTRLHEYLSMQPSSCMCRVPMI